MNTKNKLAFTILFASLFLTILIQCSAPTTTCPKEKNCNRESFCSEEICPESSTERKILHGDASPSEIDIVPREPPTWKDGSWPPPEDFRDGISPDNFGNKGLGTLCDPRADALSKDRCKKGYLCAPIGSLSVGICVKKCSTISDCPNDERCTEWPSLSDLIPSGRGCLKAAEKGEKCSFGIACKAGYQCILNISSGWGICKKYCKNREDCPPGYWCSSTVNIYGKKTSICKVFQKIPGGNCGKGIICGSGLTCVNKGKSRRCLYSCSEGTTCPKGFLCAEYSKNGKKYCFPMREEGELCDNGTLCRKGTQCIKIGAASLCLKKCSSSNDCNSTEKCVSIGKLKVCFRSSSKEGIRGEGERCHPSTATSYKYRCKRGLACIELEGDYRCLKECNGDGDCPPNGRCIQKNRVKVCFSFAGIGKRCSPSSGTFCEAGSCSVFGNLKSGVCELPEYIQRDGECLPPIKVCKKGYVCSGDPLFPFRWNCNKVCSSNSPCENGEVCTELIGGVKSCFSPCLSGGKCANNLDRCIEISDKKICVK